MMKSFEIEKYKAYLSELTYDELLDIERNIDKLKHPEKYNYVLERLNSSTKNEDSNNGLTGGIGLRVVGWCWILIGLTITVFLAIDFISQLSYKVDIFEFMILCLTITFPIGGLGLLKDKKWGKYIVIIASVISFLYSTMYIIIVGFYWGKFFPFSAIFMILVSIFSIAYLNKPNKPMNQMG